MQIRTRLTLQFSILVSAIALVAFVTIFLLVSDFAREDFFRRLHEKAITSVILLTKVDQVDSALLHIIDRAKRDNFYRETVRIYNHDNVEVYFSGDTVKLPITNDLLDEVRASGDKELVVNDFKLGAALFKNGNLDYVSIVGAIDIHGSRRLSYLRTVMFIAFFVVIAVVSFAGWVYSGRALKPLLRIMSEVENISPQNLDQRLEVSRYQDEMGKLILIFNQLLDRISKAFQLQKMFVSNVSHELKNPLTNITSQLEVTLLKDRSKEEYHNTIQSVLEDIKGLNMLSNSLLELARLTRESSNSFTMTRLRLDEILWEARDFVHSVDLGYRVEMDMKEMPEDESKLYLTGNPYLLKTAFQNLFENACKFSTDRTALVTLSVTNSRLIVKVIDKGAGIDKEDLKNVFEPFFRADAASKVKGYGIGLSLCYRIISIHKGKIDIKSTLGKGTVVTVQLNIA